MLLYCVLRHFRPDEKQLALLVRKLFDTYNAAYRYLVERHVSIHRFVPSSFDAFKSQRTLLRITINSIKINGLMKMYLIVYAINIQCTSTLLLPIVPL